MDETRNYKKSGSTLASGVSDAAADIIKSINSITGQKGNPDQVWGPPSPGQSWQDYADEVQNQQQGSQGDFQLPVQSFQPVKRPSQIISETKPLDTAYENKKPASVGYQVGRWLSDPQKVSDFVLNTGGLLTPTIYDALSNFAANITQDENDQHYFIDGIKETSDDEYSDIYNQLFSEDEMRMIPAQYEQPTQAELLSAQKSASSKMAKMKERGSMESLAPQSNYEDNTDRLIHAGRVHGIDNGLYHKDNQTSVMMTGEQYIRYREAGIPGRPIEEIDPNSSYNKIDEFKNYGFVPYVPDSESWTKMRREYTETIPQRFTNQLANVRNDNVDYTIDINGKKISGKDFDSKIEDYDKLTYEILSNADNYKGSKEEAGPNAIGLSPTRFAVTLDDGSIKEIASRSYTWLTEPPIYKDEENNPITIMFNDTGDIIDFDNYEDYINSLSEAGFEIADSDESATRWVEIPDLELSDGTMLSYAEYKNILDGGGDKDYGFLNFNKPSSEIEPFWDEEKGFNFEDTLPAFIDIALSSAPYFNPATAYPMGISGSLTATHGVDPQTMQMDGSAKKLRSDLDDNTYAGSVMGNLILPFTEKGLGRIGGGAGKLFNFLENKFGKKSAIPIARHAVETFGEGVEEIPGNLVEDYMVNGLQGLYADPLLDENGNEIIDQTGHILMDENTPLDKRWSNFWKDAPNAFIGGSLLGGAFGIPSLPGTIKETKDRAKTNRNAKKSGAGIYRPGEIANDIYIPLTPEMFEER